MEQEATATFWEWITKQDNITFLIAVISFGLSVYNFVVTIIQNSTRLKIGIPHVFRFEDTTTCAEIINLKIYNLSKVPVVVSRVSVSNNSSVGAFGSYRKRIMESKRTVRGQIVSQNIWMSDLLPVKIEANGCVNLLLLADDNRRIIDTASRNKIKIYTAKRTITRTLSASDFTDSRLLTECREPSCQ